MVESHLTEGAQALKDPKDLKYGVSITDACLGWEVTERMLRHGAETLRKAGVARTPAAAQPV
jgi:3-deoxy-7-phosphoheptulonate synthase